ncbi:MAG: response regulator transcription factor [Saprospiraceae bacterium]|nr:response regulator transcription factor [Saprospiraceae bacterium]
MTRVAIVEDKRDIREGLKNLLDTSDGYECTETYSNAESALASIGQNLPDVVLMDIELPGISGIDCVRLLSSEYENLEFIMLTVYSDEERIFSALKAGACGYLEKNVFPTALLNAIQEAKEGGAPMTPKIARKVISSFKVVPKNGYDLSPREREVLGHLCEGANYRQIASKLFISKNTVRFHLKNIYKKLHVNSKYEAVIKANKEGIL